MYILVDQAHIYDLTVSFLYVSIKKFNKESRMHQLMQRLGISHFEKCKHKK
jgi:hypothetical protein